MATQEQIEALKIDENVFELAEDSELEYLVHFAAPFTGSAKCVIPKELHLRHIRLCEVMLCICILLMEIEMGCSQGWRHM